MASRLAALLLVTSGIGACTIGPKPAPTPPAGFVQACGTKFCVNGTSFRFVGWNAPSAVAQNGCTPVRPDPEQLAAAAQASHVTVIRFMFYQDFSGDGDDYSRMDALVTAARDHGLRLMPVLGDGNALNAALWSASAVIDTCPVHTRARPDLAWYQGGFQRPYAGFSMSWEAYVLKTLQRYKDEPAIFAWMLMNEPVLDDNKCNPAFYHFFRKITDETAGADPNHLRTGGSAGPGSHGFDCESSPYTFSDIFALPNNSFVEYHDYKDLGAQPASQGSRPYTPCGPATSDNPCLAHDFAYAIDSGTKLGKPTVAGEMGLLRKSPDRPAEYRRKLKAAFDAGVAGVIPWQFAFQGGTHVDNYWFGPDDPLLPVLSSFS